MKAFIQRERIRVSPVPTDDEYKLYRLWVWLKKPLSKDNKPYVYADIVKNKKFYDLPCPIDNIIGVVVKLK